MKRVALFAGLTLFMLGCMAASAVMWIAFVRWAA